MRMSWRSTHAGIWRLRELWDPARVEAVRAVPGVARVICLGTVFAAELVPVADAAGYQSGVARGVVKRLRKHGATARASPRVEHIPC